MAHWGWYWRVKKKHTPRTSCSSWHLMELDAFDMYRNYHQQVEAVRATPSKRALHIPMYDFEAFLQDDDSLLVNYNKGSYVIPVERKPCNFGGHYYFFHCPLCDKRMRKLYCLDGQYQCRKCGNLAYYKQRLRSTTRCLLMSGEIDTYVKNRGGDLRWNKKPPRMHKKTFKHLKDRAAYYDAKAMLAMNQEGREWYGPEVEQWIDGYMEYEYQQTILEYEKQYKGTSSNSV